jgi:glycosyltransferase involved in cell wall biosynthesis
MSFSSLKLAYITSMAKGGLAGFNYREITQMISNDVKILLFVTKYVEGPYVAPNSVDTYKINVLHTIFSQVIFLFKNPVKYISLLIEAIKYGVLKDYFIAQDWKDKMVDQNANWIHCHWGDHKLYIGYFCKKLTSLPLSVTLHGYDLYDNPNWKMFEKCIKHCDQIITISNYNKKLLIQKYGDWLEKIKVIRLSADMTEDNNTFLRTKNILIVGGFEHRKGYDVLLEAIKKLDRDDVKLWIVGYDGPVDVKGLIDELYLNNKVVLFGQVSDDVLKLLFQTCDIFTMPSRFGERGVGEGLPVALMEAMSYEKPIVATRHTGIPELVPDILVDENDADGLADGFRKLIDDPELRKRMGARNREIIKNDYSNANVETLLRAFKL